MSVPSFSPMCFLHKTVRVILNFSLLLGVFAGLRGLGERLREQIGCFWLLLVVFDCCGLLKLSLGE